MTGVIVGQDMLSGDCSDLVLSLSSHLGQDSSIRLILASQSPRRVEILEMMGLKGRFDVIPSPLDESALQSKLVNENISIPAEYTRILAEEKARALAESLALSLTTNQITLVLGSDTVVDIDSRILEKPKDQADAKRMLQRLSGAEHSVHTGVALYRITPGKKEVDFVDSFTDEAMVTFAMLSDKTIDAYVATGEPMDKAGSYGIQGIGGQLVRQVQGDFFTVMGLPMHRTSRLLAKAVSNLIESVDF
ncbi:septum formation protein [Fistulifera solaris]|uniref:Septum formation protein n=1 Tax=Fistulifera solaris TaxID=1519565 RepID=A0A1Z5KA98_FISSO|nr:septum formation protein [Fistulifera solaris]|eukprot:GAX23189.1 septum formation protein [Fistulifera solaris]